MSWLQMQNSDSNSAQLHTALTYYMNKYNIKYESNISTNPHLHRCIIDSHFLCLSASSSSSLTGTGSSLVCTGCCLVPDSVITTPHWAWHKSTHTATGQWFDKGCIQHPPLDVPHLIPSVLGPQEHPQQTGPQSIQQFLAKSAHATEKLTADMIISHNSQHLTYLTAAATGLIIQQHLTGAKVV